MGQFPPSPPSHIEKTRQKWRVFSFNRGSRFSLGYVHPAVLGLSQQRGFKMLFGAAIQSYFKNYVNFKGRARRSEYWFAVLFTVLVSIGVSIVAPGHKEMVFGQVTNQPSALSQLWSLGTLLPSLAIVWRRLHDVGRSGSYFFFILIPIAGIIMLLIQLTKDSQPGENQFGAPVK